MYKLKMQQEIETCAKYMLRGTDKEGKINALFEGK